MSSVSHFSFGPGNQDGQSVCLADYCEIFGACADRFDAPCDASKLQQQKTRCEKLLLQCFPPGAGLLLALHKKKGSNLKQHPNMNKNITSW